MDSADTGLCVHALCGAWFMSRAAEQLPIRFRTFLAMSVAWLAIGYFTGQYLARLPFGFVAICVFLFAIPIALSGAYTSAVAQTCDVAYYKTSGLAFRLRSGRFIRALFWIAFALTSSFVMLLQFSTYSRLEWVALFCLPPVFWLVQSKSHYFFSGELRKRFVITSFSVFWARWLTPIAMLVLYAVLIWTFDGNQNYASLAEALEAKRYGFPERAGSAVIQLALQLTTFTGALKAYLSSNFKQISEYLPMLLTVFTGYIVFFNACATLSCFVISPNEFRRVFGPLSDVDDPAPLPKNRIAITLAVITFVALFVYGPLFAQLEGWISRHPEFIAVIKKYELKVEEIDDGYYNAGTIQKIELAKAIALGKIEVSRVALESQVDRAFDRIEFNVDGYLDWYYSLTGEYARLAKLVSGKIEDYMVEKLAERLQQGEALKELSAGIETAFTHYKEVSAEYRQTVKQILDANRVVIPFAGATVVKIAGLNDILAMPNHTDVVAFKSRVGIGAIAAVFIGGITARVVSKGVFKMAAKALSKIAISKTVGPVGGALIGASIGSTVPIVGTVAGAIAGAIVAVVTDVALLKLEEAISRDEFKKEILAAIGEARADFKLRLFGSK